uniref:Coiled-coil-helix-coiled-coil-helix domain containing 10 n=1 Tax=Gasterosteus aculeatus TaxID=69293 RepID=G3PZL4_GASAC
MRHAPSSPAERWPEEAAATTPLQPGYFPCPGPRSSTSCCDGSGSGPGSGPDGPDGDHSCRGGSGLGCGPPPGQRPFGIRWWKQQRGAGKAHVPGAPPVGPGPARPVSL